MRADIQPAKVVDVWMAVVHRTDELNNDVWEVYLLNMKNVPLEVVLVRSSGYGTVEDRRVETTELRRHYPEIPAKSAQLIEPIQEEVFGLTNQYWLSFYLASELQDKKYVFVPGSIDKRNFITIPLLNEEGVLIK